MKTPKQHRNTNRSRRSSASRSRTIELSEEEFFANPWTLAAVTYNPGEGILAIAHAHKYDDGSWGYPPHAQLPIAALDHLEGSYLAFVRCVPPDEIGMIYAACCAGDFLGALGHLSLIYCDGDDSTRGVWSSTRKRCRELDRALTFDGL